MKRAETISIEKRAAVVLASMYLSVQGRIARPSCTLVLQKARRQWMQTGVTRVIFLEGLLSSDSR